MSSVYQKAYFLLSAAEFNQLPPDIGMEVAIVGRSNSGKSSVLNRITHNKQLARVSKTPGRTQQINIFVIDEKRRIADLPGYGYAKVPNSVKQKWQKTIDTYLHERTSLKGLVLVMDSRHPFKPLDLKLLEYCEYQQLPVHILLNKADKLSKIELAKALNEAKTTLTGYSNSVSFQSFSAFKGIGIEGLLKQLNQWFAL